MISVMTRGSRVLAALMMVVSLWACGSDDDDSLRNVTTDELSIVREGKVVSHMYEQGETNFKEVEADGSVGDCFCQRLAFRSAQALQASGSFRALHPAGIPVEGIRIVTKWSTDGAEELFVDILGWNAGDVRIKINAVAPALLSLDDAVFYFVTSDETRAWKVSAQAKLFPENFFTTRVAAKTSGTAAEKAAFKAVKRDAMENYLRPLPLNDAFLVEKIDPASEELAASLAVTETTGVLVVAHGSNENEWNEDVIAAVDLVELPYPVALGFLEYHERTIAAAVADLEGRGVTRIIAVPLFICSSSNHIEEIRYVLGLRDTLPETDESTHSTGSTEDQAELVPVRTNAEIVLTRAVDDHPAVAAVLTSQLAAISQNPKTEIAVLTGHGYDGPEYAEGWNAMFTSLAAQVKTSLGLKDVRYAFAAMGEPSLAETASTAMSDGEVLVIPVMLSGGYFVDTMIPRLLTGLTYRYSSTSLLPALSAATVIEDRVERTIASLE